MKNLKITVDVKNNNVVFSNSELTNTLQEAGLSHSDLSDREEIREYFKERYKEDYNVEVEFTSAVCSSPDLKNHFAGLAMQSLINKENLQGGIPDYIVIARHAYCAADAMIKELDYRNKP